MSEIQTTLDASRPKRSSSVLDIEVVNQFGDQMWRLWNLYWIINDSGEEVRFVPNPMQVMFLKNMWYLNVILKGRQHGFTTLFCIFMFDTCFFVPNMTAGIIAHTLDDVKKIFRRKIRHPYDRLPEQLKVHNPAINDTQNELIFANKSEISVDTSVRGGTYNLLLVSEYATIAHQYPDKAREIRTGSFNTIHPGNYLFVESTGRGKGGEFYDLVMAARRLVQQKKKLGPLDFKYHFYPWWMNEKYVLPPELARQEVFTRQQTEYFNRVERITGTKLSLEQRAWYVAKARWNGEDMKREYPSLDDEPFEAVLRGALFAEQMQKAREEGRITKVPHDPALGVDTWWDIGRRDKTAIWFVQICGSQVRFIWYHEEGFKDLPYFIQLLNELRMKHRWNYRYHVGPPDMGAYEFGSGATRYHQALRLGYEFIVADVYKQEDQINAARSLLAVSWFDAENCAVGITCLDQVRREWNEHLQTYMERYRHDEYSHGASAFMTGAVMLGMLQRGRPRAQPVETRRFAT